MSVSVREKKAIYSRLRELLNISDSIYLPLDDEPNRTKILDRIAIILGGHSAQLGILLEQLGLEIEGDVEQARIMREFKQLYSDEVNKGKPSEPIEEDGLDEDDEDDYDVGGQT